MDQPPIFTKVEQDLGMEFATLTSPPYEFAQHDAEVRRRIAAQHGTQQAAEAAPVDVAPPAAQQG